MKGYYDGVIDFTINDLSPNTVYYFKVWAGNGCAPGDWSSWKMVKTGVIYYENYVSDNKINSLNEEKELKNFQKTTKESILPSSDESSENQNKPIENNQTIEVKPKISW